MRNEAISTGSVAHPPRRLHLLYHELKPSRSEYLYAVETAAFAEHLRLFTDVLKGAAGNCFLPVVTFDDGHLSDCTQALPVLAAHGWKAHFFITAGWTGNKPGYMSWSELRELHAAGHSIGAHGWSHTFLTSCDPQQLETELGHARKLLEDRLGISVTTMSLPGGRHNRHVLEACRAAGYAHVYTSIPKAEQEPFGFTIGRVNIRGDVSLEWLAQLLRPDSGLLAGLERKHRLKAGAKKLLGDRLYERVWAVLNRKEHDSEEGEAAGA